MRPASIQTPRERASDAALARLVQYVRETVQPQRIVLFGSRATGRADAESDYDLLVVVDEGADVRALTRRLYGGAVGVGVAADFVVTTPARLARHATNPGLLYRTALAEGQQVYPFGGDGG
jgi:uncharacterized protein